MANLFHKLALELALCRLVVVVVVVIVVVLLFLFFCLAFVVNVHTVGVVQAETNRGDKGDFKKSLVFKFDCPYVPSTYLHWWPAIR